MNNPIKTFASKVASTVQNKVKEIATANTNFKNRSDNTNYYKGTSYWAKNKN